MNKRKPDLVRPTAEEEAAIAAQLAEDPDTYEWTEEDWGNAQTTRELFPEAHEWAVRQKEALRDGLIQQVTITLDRETIAWFRRHPDRTRLRRRRRSNPRCRCPRKQPSG